MTETTGLESLPTKVVRLERLLRKIVEHADGAAGGTDAYARDRLRQIRALAATGVERIIGTDLPHV